MAASLKLPALVAIVAVAAIFIRYGSFDPCDWTMHEFKERAGVPFSVALSMIPEARPFDKATMGRGKCLEGWVKIVSGEISMDPAPRPKTAREETYPCVTQREKGARSI